MLDRTLLICLLTATAAPGADALAKPLEELYRAHGSDPAWSLTIAGGRMILESPGKPPVIVATPAAATEDGVVDYKTGKLRVMIMPGACTAAAGRRHTEYVYVVAGLENLRTGCGGAELPADSLDGTSWLFVEIAGQATRLTGDLLRHDRYAIDFYADGFVGYGGCNRFSAAYSRTGDVLTTKPPWGSTTGNCGEPYFGLERRLFEILRSPVRVSFPDPKSLVLTGDSGTIKLRRTR